MANQRVSPVPHKATNHVSNGSCEGVFLISLENTEVDQMVAMRAYIKANQHEVTAADGRLSSEGNP